MPTQVVRYVLNVEAFRSRIRWGRRKAVFELAGISADCLGRYYAGTALLDGVRRAWLCRETGLTHGELWITA